MKIRSTTAGVSAAAIVFGISAAVASAPAQPPAPAGGGEAVALGGPLPTGPGHATVMKVCSGCHAPEVVAQQRLTSEGWHDIVEKMADHGALGTDAEFAEITDYLVRNFSVKPGS